MKIDTKTTAGKIAVMQAFEDGKKIRRYYKDNAWVMVSDEPVWAWDAFTYDIAPETVEDAASKYRKSIQEPMHVQNKVELGFIAGAKWQKEQDNDNN